MSASISIHKAIGQLLIGLVVLTLSSRLLVWGAVQIAQDLGVSDLIIGLTIVSIGTSLPELASSITAAKKGEHDLALGNIIGSNLFNTLLVVGLAAVIHPVDIDPLFLKRDWSIMFILTVSALILGYRRNGLGRLTRIAGGGLFSSYFIYLAYLLSQS